MKTTQTVNLSMDYKDSAFVEVTYDDVDNPTGPALLEELEDHPKIQQLIDNEWGTPHLKEFLEGLLAAPRGRFSDAFMNSILRLTLANDRALEKRGLELDEMPSQFAVTGWDIPKNW